MAKGKPDGPQPEGPGENRGNHHSAPLLNQAR